MSGAAPAQDPSMEDILASIRKILNEEEAASSDPVREPERAPEPLELTEAMLVTPTVPVPVRPAAPASAAPPSAPPPAPVSPAPDAGPSPVAPSAAPVAAPIRAMEAPPAESPPSPAPAPTPAVPDAAGAGIVAPATAAVAAALMGQLARTVAAERAATVHRGGPSIEDVVREEVRHLLKAWMDAHLPAMMERLVRAEIERVIGRSPD